MYRLNSYALIFVFFDFKVLTCLAKLQEILRNDDKCVLFKQHQINGRKSIQMTEKNLTNRSNYRNVLNII